MTDTRASKTPKLLRGAALPRARGVARNPSGDDVPPEPSTSRGFGWGRNTAKKPSAQKVSAWGNLGQSGSSAVPKGTETATSAEPSLSPLARRGDDTAPAADGGAIDGRPAKPADLRRPGPFANEDMRSAAAARSAPSLSGARITGEAPAAPILRLDDFEAPTKNWQRKRLDPVAPRVHPNPIPVSIASRKAMEENVAKASLAGDRKTARKATKKLKTARSKTKGAKARRASGDRWYYITVFVISAAVIGLLINWYNQQLGNPIEPVTRNLSETEQVLAAERALSSLGFEPGAIDGVRDFQLQAAILQFQDFAGLPANGQLNDDVLSELQALSQLGGQN